jgi:hypothetical protein
MSQPIPMTGDQIADLIVKDVRRHAHCTDFKSISVHKIADDEIPGTNWSCGQRVDCGGSDEKACADALREVIPRMQRQYRIS